MVRLLPGDPYTAAGWLFSFSELPDIFWTQNSSIGASIDRGQWGDPFINGMASERCQFISCFISGYTG